MDEMPEEYQQHLRMREGEELFKLKGKVLAQEGTIGQELDPCRSFPTQGIL